MEYLQSFETNKTMLHYALILPQCYECAFDRPSIIYVTNICLDISKASDISILSSQAFLCLALLNFLASSTHFKKIKTVLLLFYVSNVCGHSVNSC